MHPLVIERGRPHDRNKSIVALVLIGIVAISTFASAPKASVAIATPKEGQIVQGGRVTVIGLGSPGFNVQAKVDGLIKKRAKMKGNEFSLNIPVVSDASIATIVVELINPKTKEIAARSKPVTVELR